MAKNFVSKIASKVIDVWRGAGILGRFFLLTYAAFGVVGLVAMNPMVLLLSATGIFLELLFPSMRRCSTRA
ncbi:hypothetical protein [Rhodococcus sp. OK519]|uniref:hypothetical protein n=1 Tax=Rhodococcus sp. OK519 TaxID=2135729 RepID=UPI000D34AE1B